MSGHGGARPVVGLVRGLLRDQRVAFLLVGAANLVIGLAWFAVIHALAGDRVGYMATLVIAYAFAVVCAFVLHRRLVFKVRGQVWTDFARFSLVQVGSLTVNALALPFLVEVVGLPVLPAQMSALVVVIVFNYFGHLMFSFRRAEDPPAR